MKKQLLISSILLLTANITRAQAPAPTASFDTGNNRTWGVGIQTAFPLYGASIKYRSESGLGVQAVIGPFAYVGFYGGRLLYNFKTASPNTSPYLYGQMGSVSVLGLSAFSLGGGGGLEFFSTTFPGLAWSLEIGYATLGIAEYDLGTLTFGGGLHYYFK